MKKILLNSIVLLTVVIGIGTLVSSVSACVCEMPGCTDPGALNYDPEATIDDGSCEYEELKGSITICKIITDSESNIIDGSGFPGTEFSISVAGQDITFTTPLTLNRSFWEDYSHEAQCIIISELDITEYFYSEEIYPSSGWEIPLYNDQFDVQVQSLDDSFILDLSNDDSDGHIVLTEQRPDRTLVVFNKQKGEEEIPGCTNLEAVNYDPEANIDDGTCEYPEPEKVTINAYKVVCDNESDLPNWTDSGAPALINENTAQDYVSQSQEACHLETD